MDKMKGVRDIRSDHRAELKHMYSLLAVKYRVIAPPMCGHFVCLESIPIANFLPTKADVVVLKSNLVVLVSSQDPSEIHKTSLQAIKGCLSPYSP